MPDHLPVTETETEPKLQPTGLVDPRAIHPAPDDAQREIRPETMPGEEETSNPGAVSQEESGTPAVNVVGGTGLSDPRDSLPGPDLVI
jgi:hypothetical protein